ncbi:phytoene/squalene synthase family protein [Halorubrum gandharaense]
MASQRTFSPEPDSEWCHDALQDVSRTFALTVDLLEEPMSSHICLGYLLCRIADTVEDAGHIPPEAQTTLLDTYGRAIDPDTETDIATFRTDVDEWIPADRNDDWDVVARSPTVVATFDELDAGARSAIVPPVLEMVDGMEMFIDRYADAGGLRIENPDELEKYCYYVAGTVGNLITNLLARNEIEDGRERRLHENDEEFGKLLQLVNVTKDVHDDYTEENNVYLPAEWFESEGVDQDEAIEPENREPAARVVSRTADHARSFLDHGQAYLEAMPLSHGNTIEAWSVPYLLAVGTLRELSENPQDALTSTDVKITREEVLSVMSAASDANRDALTDLRREVAQQPFHEH